MGAHHKTLGMLATIELCASRPQALALLLCIVVFLIASTAYNKLLNAPRSQQVEDQEQTSMRCGLIVLSQRRHAKLLDFFLGMKGR